MSPPWSWHAKTTCEARHIQIQRNWGGFRTRSTVYRKFRQVNEVIILLIQRIKNRIDRVRCGFLTVGCQLSRMLLCSGTRILIHVWICICFNAVQDIDSRRRLSLAFTAASGKLFSFHFILEFWYLPRAPAASRCCSDIIRIFHFVRSPPSWFNLIVFVSEFDM